MVAVAATDINAALPAGAYAPVHVGNTDVAAQARSRALILMHVFARDVAGDPRPCPARPPFHPLSGLWHSVCPNAAAGTVTRLLVIA